MAKNLLVIAQEMEGFKTVMDMLSDATNGIQCPGVCKHCHFVEIDVDQDQQNGLCENCGQNTVSSVLMLAGLI